MDIKKLQELKKSLQANKAALKAYRDSRAAATGGTTAPDFNVQEKRVSAKWGCKSLTGRKDSDGKILEKGILHLNTADRAFRAMKLEDREAIKNFKEANDVVIMCATRFKVQPQETAAYEEILVPSIKALGIESGEVGNAWIPTQVSDNYVEEYNLERKVASLFQEIKMPSNPYKSPVLTNGAVARKLAENTARSPKDSFTDSVITFTAVKIALQYELPEELTEDSAVDVMKAIRLNLIEGQEKAIEIAILNGDTTSTHMDTETLMPGDSGTPDSDSAEKLWKGLRKRALAAGSAAKVDCEGNPINEAYFAQGRQQMGKFGVNPAELAFICGPKVYNEMLQLDDCRTLNEYGTQAPVLSGELAKYEGIPVVVSEYQREDTNSAGVNGASANDFCVAMLVNRKRFYIGVRRAIQIRVENYRTAYDTWDMVSYQRKAFDGVLLADGSNFSTEKSVQLFYDIG